MAVFSFDRATLDTRFLTIETKGPKILNFNNMFQLLQTTLGRLRVIAFIEGVSFLILLFIAMPLKYIWGNPLAVRQVGSAHGLLFVLYVMFVVLCRVEYRWPARKVWILMVLSIIPFGNFYADKQYLQR
jgi:integral membrane protein